MNAGTLSRQRQDPAPAESPRRPQCRDIAAQTPKEKLKAHTISDYKLISAGKLVGFADKVNEEIAEGWQPYGPPQIATAEIDGAEDLTICQAMVKYQP